MIYSAREVLKRPVIASDTPSSKLMVHSLIVDWQKFKVVGVRLTSGRLVSTDGILNFDDGRIAITSLKQDALLDKHPEVDLDYRLLGQRVIGMNDGYLGVVTDFSFNVRNYEIDSIGTTRFIWRRLQFQGTDFVRRQIVKIEADIIKVKNNPQEAKSPKLVNQPSRI